MTGRWTRQDIVLDVPTTQDVITVQPMLSNTNNFILEDCSAGGSTTPLEISAGCPLIMPLTFVPTMLGAADQTATVVFRSPQVCNSLSLVGNIS